jgi:hypothetical protein
VFTPPSHPKASVNGHYLMPTQLLNVMLE